LRSVKGVACRWTYVTDERCPNCFSRELIVEGVHVRPGEGLVRRLRCWVCLFAWDPGTVIVGDD